MTAGDDNMSFDESFLSSLLDASDPVEVTTPERSQSMLEMLHSGMENDARNTGMSLVRGPQQPTDARSFVRL